VVGKGALGVALAGELEGRGVLGGAADGVAWEEGVGVVGERGGLGGGLDALCVGEDGGMMHVAYL